MKLNEHDIQTAIARQLGFANIAIPNCQLRGRRSERKDKGDKITCLRYEADLLIIKPTNYLHEIEIKIDINDFKRDIEKRNFHSSPFVSSLWYAFPEELYLKHKKYIDDNLGEAGCIVVSEIPPVSRKRLGQGYGVEFVKKPKRREEAKKLTDKQKEEFLRKAAYKWWTRKY